MDARLEAILSRVHGSVLADIGCDHGKVAVYAVLRGLVRRSIAADISKACLDKARALAKERGAEAVEFRLGDGMSVLAPYEADCVVIAGMGGREMIKILSCAPPSDAEFILVPHDDAPLLRGYLAREGYAALSDVTVKAGGKFYPVIVCKKDGVSRTLSTEELLYGSGASTAERLEYMRQREKALQDICGGMDKNAPAYAAQLELLQATRRAIGRGI